MFDTHPLDVPISGDRYAPRQTGYIVAQPAFATMEDVRHADELRLQLRARLLRDAASTTPPWCVGVD